MDPIFYFLLSFSFRFFLQTFLLLWFISVSFSNFIISFTPQWFFFIFVLHFFLLVHCFLLLFFTLSAYTCFIKNLFSLPPLSLKIKESFNLFEKKSHLFSHTACSFLSPSSIISFYLEGFISTMSPALIVTRDLLFFDWFLKSEAQLKPEAKIQTEKQRMIRAGWIMWG